jgi:hypothetical protein
MDLGARLHSICSDDTALEAESWVAREIGGCDFSRNHA